MNVKYLHTEGKYYYIDITKGHVFENMGSSFVHKNIKAALKRLDKTGNWKFVCDPEWDIERIVKEASKIHIARQHELSRDSIFETDSGYQYMFSVIASFHSRNEIKSFWLFVNDIPVAFIIGFSLKSTFYVWTIAFHPESKQYYPGKFLYYKVIEYCVENNYKVFSFMRGEGDYKDKWTPTYEINHRFRIYNQKGLYNKLVNLDK